MTINSVPWAIPDFGSDEKQALHRVVESGWMTMGEETRKLESELSSVTGKKHNIVFNSGTNAIVASLLAIGAYHEGYTVRIPSYTFKATENAVYASGLTEVKYGEVNKYTGLMTPKESDKRYEIQVPVHYAGLPLDENIWGELPSVVEDAAESFGSTTKYKGKISEDRLTCYSFHAAKVITMIEGGCVSTDSDELSYNLKSVRCHGEDPDNKGVFIRRGLNMKPLDLCSAVGRVQLRKLPQYISNRNEIATLYRNELCGYVRFQEVPEYVETHSNMMFPIYVDNPLKVSEHLKKNRVGHRLGWKPLKNTAGAEYLYNHIICIPMYNTLTLNEALYVVDKVKESLK